MKNKALNVVILPGGALQLEWADTREAVTRSRHLLQTEIYKRFTDDGNSWLFFLGFCDQQVMLSPSLNYWRGVTGKFVEKLCRTPDLETIRHRVDIVLDKDERQLFLEQAPLMTGSEYLCPDLLEDVWSGLNRAFGRAIQPYTGTVSAFIRAHSPNAQLVGRVFFHLVENKGDAYPFAFMATYSTRLNDQGKSRHLPLKHALETYGKDSDKLLVLLTTVTAAARKSSFMAGLVESGELFQPTAWTAHEAFLFLKEIPLYEESGILCRIPNWWKGRASGPRLNFSVGDKKPSFVGMDALLSFNPALYIGDMKISEKQARQLLNESEGLAFIKNKWVAVDPEKLKQTLAAYEKAKKRIHKGGLSLKDALHLQLTPEKFSDVGAGEIDSSVTNGKWLKSVMGKLVNPDLITRTKAGSGFTGALRKYQQSGLNWLYFLHSLGFGACLADDMGLGKTIQVLAFLTRIKSDTQKLTKRPGASLLVVPASLLSNWAAEINAFAPELDFHIAHPGTRAIQDTAVKGEKLPDAFDPDTVDLVITTYGLAQKYDWLKTYLWHYLILDEAQAIKNPVAKQTRAIKKLAAGNRIVMTGTPIENRLTDLWSLFDFLNPGLLGNMKEFKGFIKNLNADQAGYTRLRRLISPYILRRLKTDRFVISDLPDKVEMKTYAPLSKKQVLLYEKLVAGIKALIEDTAGIQRKGIILSSIMKFKQLCNHPDQYLGTGGFAEKESGKFIRLREICETIYEKREKVLVFTQFKEMTGPLSNTLETIFQRKGLVLHGSVAVGKRKKLVEQFQTKDYHAPFMVLSLKAGGVGLNLTEANHVIHFDRWWNPAVENQATDRAFRIGQKKNVIVHKFLTRGTVEEKIDRMLTEKSRLSEDVIADTGQAWITEMKNDELMDLFHLTL